MKARQENTEKGPQEEPELPYLKRTFPFRLSTTSYVIPAAIMPNIRFLGPYLDEVELVLFESRGEDNLPKRGEIKEMCELAQQLDLTYSVHLPTDIFLGDPDPEVRNEACQTALRFIRRTLPLDPACYILHLERNERHDTNSGERRGWIERMKASLETIVAEGVGSNHIAVENLNYPLEWIQDLVVAMGMSFCLDVGHLVCYGYDLNCHFQDFLDRTSMIHLHGVLDGVDHRGLQFISEEEWALIIGALENYQRGLCIEVFSLNDLRSSLARMKEALC